MPPFTPPLPRCTPLAAATPCTHCPEPAYAVWHLPRGLGRVWLCKAHFDAAEGVSLIPAGAQHPRRVDDDPPPLPSRREAAEGRT